MAALNLGGIREDMPEYMRAYAANLRRAVLRLGEMDAEAVTLKSGQVFTVEDLERKYVTLQSHDHKARAVPGDKFCTQCGQPLEW